MKKSSRFILMIILHYIFTCFINQLYDCMQALDLWMAGCMVFVFAALAEFVVVSKKQGRETYIFLKKIFKI